MNGVSLADLANEIVAMAKSGGKARKATGLWRDKSGRGAAWCGRVFSGAYGASARGAPDRRSLRYRDFYKDFRVLARCGGPRQ